METLDVFPSISDIKTIADANSLASQDAKLVIDEMVICDSCSSGIVIMRHKENFTRWTFSCHCANGRAQYSFALYGYKIKTAKWRRDPTLSIPVFMAPPVFWGENNNYAREFAVLNSISYNAKENAPPFEKENESDDRVDQ